MIPGGRPDQVIRAKMARNVLPEGLDKEGLRRFLITFRAERSEVDHNSGILRAQGVEIQDLRVTEEDLRMEIAECDSWKWLSC